MLYNAEQLNEIITEYIVQEFKEFDVELISLHRRVQELTNHVAVVQKKIEQISKNAGDGSEIEMSFHHSIHEATDDWQILIHFKPTAPDQGLKDVTRLWNLLHYSNTKMWDKLTGGGHSCFFCKRSRQTSYDIGLCDDGITGLHYLCSTDISKVETS